MKRLKRFIEDLKISHQEAFPYRDLPQGGYFRYLILQPGNGEEPLRCNLRTAQFTKTRFEAISYVWGSNVKDAEVICGDRIMHITTNLSMALQRVRLPDAPRRLWADSICINQDDLNEKGHQVAVMGSIYRRAERVLIHMGHDDEGSGPHVCSLLNDIDKMIEDTCKQIDMSWDSFPYPDKNDPILIDGRWKSLYKLLGQDWFDRGWVVREAALAQHCQVMWGKTEFDWDKLMRAVIWLRKRARSTYFSNGLNLKSTSPHRNAYRIRHESFARAFHSKTSWGSSSVLDNLKHARHLQLTDPRDRIYAFMNLSLDSSQNSNGEISLYPNYNDSYQEVYRHFAIQYLQSTKHIKLLDYVSHNTDTFESDIPSWVPRWDMPKNSLAVTFLSFPALKPRSLINQEPVVVNQTTLKVRGVTVDTICYATAPLQKKKITQESIRTLWTSVAPLLVESPYTPTLRLYAFLAVLCGGAYRGDWLARARARAAFVLEARLCDDFLDRTQLAYDAAATTSDELDVFLREIEFYTRDRKFIITTRGYMGLAPAAAQEGDPCAIVFGCHSPCILRRATKKNRYSFVGATTLIGRQPSRTDRIGARFDYLLGDEYSKDWVEWDVEEEDIYLC